MQITLSESEILEILDDSVKEGFESDKLPFVRSEITQGEGGATFVAHFGSSEIIDRASFPSISSHTNHAADA